MGAGDDEACVALLRWALPRLRMRWPGFRKVRGQVCKRIRRRMKALGLADMNDYRAHLERHADEWQVLDGLCQISISRFFRDRGVFAFLGAEVLPKLAERALARGASRLRTWSAGCGSGEEPYSLAILWQLGLQTRYPQLGFKILATDANAAMVRRARAACYPGSSLKELEPAWRRAAFSEQNAVYKLKDPFKQAVEIRQEDLRERTPGASFDLIMCRNLAFTYFDRVLQHEILLGLCQHLHEGGALVIGSHERLPVEVSSLCVWSESCRIYRKVRV